jgi:hypothetical protein
MTADTASVVDDLGPLDWCVSSWLWLDHTFRFETGENISRTRAPDFGFLCDFVLLCAFA